MVMVFQHRLSTFGHLLNILSVVKSPILSLKKMLTPPFFTSADSTSVVDSSKRNKNLGYHKNCEFILTTPILSVLTFGSDQLTERRNLQGTNKAMDLFLIGFVELSDHRGLLANNRCNWNQRLKTAIFINWSSKLSKANQMLKPQ